VNICVHRWLGQFEFLFESRIGSYSSLGVRLCVIFNPVARGDKARHLRRHLDELSAQCVLKPTAKAGDARTLAGQAVREGFDTIVAAGGDGTVNEVLNGIGDVPGGFSQAALGILPLGTVNVFAREIGMPLNLRQAWDVICRGSIRTIDLPLAEFVVGGQSERRYFIQLAGAGLDSRAVELVNWKLKKRIGPFAYVAAGLQALRETHPVITVAAEGQSISGELVLLGNGRLYGGKFLIFSQANLHDGVLDLCVFPKVNWGQLLRAGCGLLSGRLHQLCRARQLQSKAFTLSSPQRVLLQLDGDNVGELPAKISVQPKALRVLVP
jgi:diacylglycerol kinase (ATP)